jgi:hypothetical protein
MSLNSPRPAAIQRHVQLTELLADPARARNSARPRVRQKEIAMDVASLPILLTASPALRKALGADLRRVAVLAVQAMLRHGRGLEVALQQIDYRQKPIVFSSRVGRLGDLILEMDVGNPALGERIFLEADLRKAQAAARAGSQRTARR